MLLISFMLVVNLGWPRYSHCCGAPGPPAPTGGQLEGLRGHVTAGPSQQRHDGRHQYILPPAPRQGTGGICQNICNNKLELGISVLLLMLSQILEGGHLH